jgi:hypothetical protein
MKVFYFILFVLFSISLTFCTSKCSKYESFWLIDTFEVYGRDATPLILIYNFEINVKISSATPPAVQYDPDVRKRVKTSRIKFFSRSGKDFLRIYDHYFFEGTYEIKCLDEKCCQISLKDDAISLVLTYNGPLNFQRDGRDCPEVEFNLHPDFY